MGVQEVMGKILKELKLGIALPTFQEVKMTKHIKISLRFIDEKYLKILMTKLRLKQL